MALCWRPSRREDKESERKRDADGRSILSETTDCGGRGLEVWAGVGGGRRERVCEGWETIVTCVPLLVIIVGS